MCGLLFRNFFEVFCGIPYRPPTLTGGLYVQGCVKKLENCILLDWVSITSKIHSPQNFMEMLGLEKCSWELMEKGAHGYHSRLYYDHISIHFNGREDMGVWCELSGQGCRAFESFGSGDYEGLFQEVFSNPGDMHITRLDVAFDDLEHLLDIETVCRDARKAEYVSKFRTGAATYGLGDDTGKSVLLGSRSSEALVRIYDKAAERGFNDRHWIQVELQLRRERAAAFLQRTEPIGERFAGVLANYLRFIDEPNGFDSNRWRWPMKPYWADLMGGARRIRLYEKPGSDYNMINLENFVFKQAGNAIYTYLETHTMEQFLEGLRSRGTQLSPKYKSLLAQYGKKC